MLLVITSHMVLKYTIPTLLGTKRHHTKVKCKGML